MRTFARVLALSAIVAGAVLTTVAPAAAHERRAVGTYQFVVGWKVEPAFSDVNNAVQIFVRDGSGNPVTLGADDLKVEVIQSGQKSDVLPLKSVFNSPGEYNAPMLPTRPGTYTFHFTGAIAGQKVDESFTSSDHTFNDMQNASNIQFPAKDPTRGELAQNLTRSDERIADSQTRIVQLQADLTRAQQAADTDRWLAIAGIVLGVLGILALATMVWLERRRRSEDPAVAAPSPSGATGE